MKSQDDIAFQSQQFANQVGERADRTSMQGNEMLMQAPAMTHQLFQNAQRFRMDQAGDAAQLAQNAQRFQMDQQRFRMEQAGDAAQLAKSELELRQARDEMAWSRELVGNKMVLNALRRDKAQTELAELNAAEQKRKMSGGMQAPGLMNVDYAMAAIAGVGREWDEDTGKYVFSKRNVSPEEKALAESVIARHEKDIQTRYGSHATSAPRLPAQDDPVKLMQIGRDAEAAGDFGLAEQSFTKAANLLGFKPTQVKEDPVRPPAATQIGSDAKLNTPTIQGFGPKNTSRAIDYLSQPDVIAKARKSLMRLVPVEEREGYNPSDAEVLEKSLNILRDPADPRRSGMINYLREMGLVDDKEYNHEAGVTGITNLDVSRFIGPQ